MSYCRMGKESDVYLIRTFDGTWDCFCKSPCITLTGEQQVLDHLLEHQAKGDKVPDYTIERITRERDDAAHGEGEKK